MEEASPVAGERPAHVRSSAGQILEIEKNRATINDSLGLNWNYSRINFSS